MIGAGALAFAANAFAASPASPAAKGPPLDVAHQEAKQAVANKPIMRTENADYQKALKDCKTKPVSERTTCISEAGLSADLAAKARKELGVSP